MKRCLTLITLLYAFCLPSNGQTKNQIDNIIVNCLQSTIDHWIPWLDSSEIYICKDGLPYAFPYNLLPDTQYYSVDNISSTYKRWELKRSEFGGI